MQHTLKPGPLSKGRRDVASLSPAMQHTLEVGSLWRGRRDVASVMLHTIEAEGKYVASLWPVEWKRARGRRDVASVMQHTMEVEEKDIASLWPVEQMG